jgi:hypothetical protein
MATTAELNASMTLTSFGCGLNSAAPGASGSAGGCDIGGNTRHSSVDSLNFGRSTDAMPFPLADLAGFGNSELLRASLSGTLKASTDILNFTWLKARHHCIPHFPRYLFRRFSSTPAVGSPAPCRLSAYGRYGR